MALLPILEFPDVRLRTVARPVTQFDEKLSQLASDMTETMYAAPGIGLAATQVDVHLRMLVVDVSEDKSGLRVLINPEILAASDDAETEEGCLSVPGIYEPVVRPNKITVKTHTLSGDTQRFQAEGLLAVCIQHEIDHLDGKVFVDYLSMLKRERIKSKLKKRSQK